MVKFLHFLAVFALYVFAQTAYAESVYDTQIGAVQFVTSRYDSTTIVDVIENENTLGEFVFKSELPSIQHAVLRTGLTDLKIDAFYSLVTTSSKEPQAVVEVAYQMGNNPQIYQGEIARWNLVL